MQLAAKSLGEHTSLAPKNVQQIVYGARILRGFRSTGAGDDDGGTTSTANLAGQFCRVVGSAAVAGSDNWEHLVELNSDEESIPLAELTRLQPDAIRLPVRSASDHVTSFSVAATNYWRAGYQGGVRVTVVGVQSKPELNGERVEVLSWDDSTGRYVVQVAGAQAPMALRPRNCQV